MSRRPETEEERRIRKEKERTDRPRREETEEERRIRKDREREGGRREETEEERRIRKDRERAERDGGARRAETEEERRIRKERERAERDGGAPPGPRREETEDERRIRKERERAERDGGSRRPETEEERRVRKEKERTAGAERPRREETEEERRIRKDKERAERDGGAAGSRRQETEEERRIRKDKERAEKERVYKPLKPAVASPAKGGDDDYEDDFEEEVFDEGQLSAAQKAIEAENAAIRAKRAAAAEAKQPGAAPRSLPAAEVEGEAREGFDRKSLEEQRAKAQFEKDFARASALRRLVDLDTTSFPSLAEVPPLSQYDLFIRGVGGAGRNTISIQAPPVEDRVSVEVQAERVAMKSKGCDAPGDLGLAPEKIAVRRATEEEQAAATEGATSKSGEKESEKEKKRREKEREIARRRQVDVGALSTFLTRAGAVMCALLDEEAAANGSDAAPAAASAAAANLPPFLLPAALPFGGAEVTEGRPVIKTATSPCAPAYILSVHGPPAQPAAPGGNHGASSFPGLIAVWNLHTPQHPERILVSLAEITDAAFSPSRPHLVYAGTAQGTVCVWDTREPANSHFSSKGGVLRLPSFSTDCADTNHSLPVQRVVVCGNNNVHGAAADASGNEQVASVDHRGNLFFWVLSESAQSGGFGFGGVSLLASPTGATPLMGKPNFDGAGAAASSIGALDALLHATSSATSSVRLTRTSTMCALEDLRRSAATGAAGKEGATKGGASAAPVAVGAVYDMRQSLLDPTCLLLATANSIAHVSRFGNIVAPSAYLACVQPGSAAGSSSSNPTASALCVSLAAHDSRLVLGGYSDGAVRLFLHDDATPKLTAHISEHPIVCVRVAAMVRWLCFALDAAGNLFVLDFAIASRTKPVAHAKLASSRRADDQCTTFCVMQDDRAETRIALGFKSGAVELVACGDSVIAPAAHRDLVWL